MEQIIITHPNGTTLNLPEVAEMPKNTLEKVKGWVKQGSELYDEYPKIGDFLIGLVSGAAASLGGVAVGSKISDNNNAADEQKHELNNNVEPQEINFNENGTTYNHIFPKYFLPAAKATI